MTNLKGAGIALAPIHIHIEAESLVCITLKGTDVEDQSV